MNGIFTISLDFELHWGGFEKWHLGEPVKGSPDMRPYFLNTRRLIPQMLEALRLAEVQATWATVGLLFLESRSELDEVGPVQRPGYPDQILSAYNYIGKKGIGMTEEDDPFHFAPGLIRQIGATPGMEVASHTFGHYYTCESGQTPDQFRADLQAAKRIAAKAGFDVRSLVLPRNQVNPIYLPICFQEGFDSVRVNPGDWFWEISPDKPVPMWHRFNRTADAYLPIGVQKSYPLKSIHRNQGEPWQLRASRFLRPYHPHHFLLNNLRMSRIKNEMTTAAKQGEVYHLWWHPHNFGAYPAKSMADLKEILDHYSFLRDKYGMQSLNMASLVSLRESL